MRHVPLLSSSALRGEPRLARGLGGAAESTRVNSRNESPDLAMMRRAIILARRSEGRVEPNPMVGCVIARGSRILGEGYHRRFGGPHAEIEALANCRTSPKGATAYVTLEPCRHHGKTPPCTSALIEAGIARVVVACRDPNALMRGRGLRVLRSAGLVVETGLLAADAAETLAPYATWMTLRRPYVIAKWAQSLDGKVAARHAPPRWISCEASRRRVHRLRGRVDAVLVGSGTVAADNPRLTARGVCPRRTALRVVLDGRLRVPLSCHLVVTASTLPTLVMTRTAALQSRKADRLRSRRVEVMACRLRRGRLSPVDVLRRLAGRGATNVLLEGGPTVLNDFFQAGLVDEAVVFTAPTLIGGQGTPGPFAGPPGGHGATGPDIPLSPHSVTVGRCGVDVVHRLRFADPAVLLKAR